MSRFYGQVEGRSQTIATRMGDYGIHTSAQSFEGSVCVFLDYYEHDAKEVCVEIQINEGSSAYGTPFFSGTIEELKECFELWRDNYACKSGPVARELVEEYNRGGEKQ